MVPLLREGEGCAEEPGDGLHQHNVFYGQVSVQRCVNYEDTELRCSCEDRYGNHRLVFAAELINLAYQSTGSTYVEGVRHSRMSCSR